MDPRVHKVPEVAQSPAETMVPCTQPVSGGGKGLLPPSWVRPSAPLPHVLWISGSQLAAAAARQLMPGFPSLPSCFLVRTAQRGGWGRAPGDTLTSERLNFSFRGAERKPRMLQVRGSPPSAACDGWKENLVKDREAVRGASQAGSRWHGCSCLWHVACGLENPQKDTSKT